ncbi:hypothetical protein BS47DRAFT_1294821, partial [Hydnum rufescens UP504]
LVAEVDIHGVQALAMIDTGSETDAMSPDFTHACNIPVFTLDTLIPLQLGCKGSKLVISYGTQTTIRMGPHKTEHYFDIVNIDKYNVILGTPSITWMR